MRKCLFFLANLVVPGAAFLDDKRYGRFIAAFLVITSLAVFGALMGGRSELVWNSDLYGSEFGFYGIIMNLFIKLETITKLLVGCALYPLLTKFFSVEQGMTIVVEDIGTTYLVIAGLMNFFIGLHIFMDHTIVPEENEHNHE